MSDGYWEAGLAALDFKNYVAVNKTLVGKYGLHVAVLVGEFSSEARLYASRGELLDGWFYATVERVESHTGLNAYYQREAIARMVDEGLVEVAYRGMPKRRHIRVNPKAVIDSMSDRPVERQSLNQCTSSGEDSERQVVNPVDAINYDNKLEEVTMNSNVEDGHLFSMEPERPGGKRADKFVPPTIEEVSAWVKKKGYHFDPQQFLDYYEADDWRMRNGRRVKSWKRCCVTWEKYSAHEPPKRAATGGDDFSEFVRVDGVSGNWG